MTKPSDYVGWFDPIGIDANRSRKLRYPGETLTHCAEITGLLTELGIDATGLKPSNLLRTIACAFDAKTAKGRSTAKQSTAA